MYDSLVAQAVHPSTSIDDTATSVSWKPHEEEGGRGRRESGNERERERGREGEKVQKGREGERMVQRWRERRGKRKTQTRSHSLASLCISP